MKFWPRSLLYRLLLIVLLGLLLANGLSLTLVMIERMSSARNVMLGNLEQDVATSVAILDRLPADERAEWLPQLARGNYRYLLGEGEPGNPPHDARSRDAIRTITDTLAGRYPLRFTAVPGPVSHIQAHVTLRDGAPEMTLAALRTFLRDRLGRHEMPAALELRDTLPRTPAGKLMASALVAEERARSLQENSSP